MLSPGTQLGQFEVTGHLGSGGMGEVYRARDTKLGREVAIKVLPEGFAKDRDRLTRFEREAKVLASLDHPNIGALHDFQCEQGVHFLVLQLVEGETLGKRIDKGPLPVKEALPLFIQIAEAMEAAHEQGIIHRDLKPDNVKVAPDGKVKVLDFGMAKSVGPVHTSSSTAQTKVSGTDPTKVTTDGMILGTPSYMSPEQAKGAPVTPASDIFSFGCVLYEVLTGVRSFRRGTLAETLAAVLDDDPPPFNQGGTAIPQELQRIILQCLDKDPGARFPDATHLRDALALAQSNLSEPSGFRLLSRVARRPRFALPVAALLLIAAFLGVQALRTDAERKRARSETLPEIERLIELEEFATAFDLAREIEAVIPEDAQLDELWPKLSVRVSIRTEPADADVYVREYAADEGQWRPLGPTPVDGALVPRGAFEWRIEKDGFERAEGAVLSLDMDIDVTLGEANSLPPGMVRVPDTGFWLELRDLEPLHGYPLREYYIDKFEVTNREFLEFVRAGGYEKEDHWTHPFIDRFGGRLDREAAMEIFRDSTDQPGPASWEAGTYPEGEDDYPVTGVSWYEAAAFAQFKGKRLPTFFHWFAAATGEGDSLDPSFADVLIPASNFSGRGPSPVGAHPGIGPYGSYDMAGNVKEWVFNASGNLRFILGGAWNEGALALTSAYPESPMDRHSTYGFRCALYPGEEEPPELLFRSIRQTGHIDYEEVTPASDDVFAFYKSQFSYDATDLEPEIVQLESTSDLWTKEKISFNAAYGGERMFAYLYLPTRVDPPCQTIVYFPGNGAVSSRSSVEAPQFQIYDFIIKSGRAVIVPVYKSTYERRDHLRSVYPDTTRDYTDHVLMWVKDVMRSVDYLETRDDIDTARLGYFGYSWGAGIASLALAVEDRLDLGVMLTGGFALTRGKSEVRAVHYAPRVKVPVLMLNGEYDSIFPLETSQRPLFRMLGTSDEDKRHLTYPTGHSVPRNDIIRETLAWLDRYFGPVRRAPD